MGPPASKAQATLDAVRNQPKPVYKSRNPAAMADPNTAERVMEPRQVDVLCGRGGMSNHHPGNEWYRRLIKSNRPLYRACPKHTKLLVAKAIVQAVEQQDGRFLEKDKGSGNWYVVPYKRAVDKTSQGLREKDPEERAEKKANVPDGFSGKSKAAPNLNDLARVTIAHANRMNDTAPQGSTATPSSTKTPPASAAKAQKPARKGGRQSEVARLQQQQDLMKRLAKASAPQPPKRLSPPTATQPVKRRLSGFQLPTQQGKRIRRDDVPQATLAPRPSAKPTIAENDPLPPDMQVRASSMFRMLKHTQLLPGTSSSSPPQQKGLPLKSVMKKPPPPQQQQQQQQQSKQQRELEQLELHKRQQMVQMQQARQMRMEQQRQYSQYTNIAPAATTGATTELPEQVPPPGNGENGPALTRFTSQVSDWLNSFWPVETGRQSSVQQVQNEAARLASTSNATNVARKDPPPGVWAPNDPQLAASVPAATAAASATLVDKAAPQPSKSSRKRKSTPMPPLPYGLGEDVNDPSKNNGASYQIPMDAMPTELEQSVSATLLKLAASPSKLFTGLTSFFGDNGESAVVATNEQQLLEPSMKQQAAAEIPSPPPGPVAAAGKSKPSKNSLLDDYDETPMEARLRTVAWK